MTKHQGKSVTYQMCFQFADSSALADNITEYKLWITDSRLDLTSYYCCNENITIAIEDATKQLYKCNDIQQLNTSYVEVMQENNVLKEGYQIISSMCEYQLIMQGDGNLVVYSFEFGMDNPIALWNSATSDKTSETAYFVAQSDGNLVVYTTESNTVLWNSGTSGQGTGPYKLVMQDDGNLVYYDSTNTAIWNTGTGSDP